ncbi:hypothetical protein GGR54DRAFT_419230 [Hypoxylon sp. NC1633]|nr:hypothetical protein GGR54DRAFT_419230 [Hypoxylon sp. NC1633]
MMFSAAAEASASQTGSVPCETSGILATDTLTSSRSPFSVVPSSGWNATASHVQSPVAISTSNIPGEAAPSIEPETTPTVSLPPMPSLPPPVSEPPSSLPSASDAASEIQTGASEGCASMTTLTMSSRTFSWCAQVATSHTVDVSATAPEPSIFADQSGNPNTVPVQTIAGSTLAGPYTFSARHNIELQGPSTLSTVVVRSPGLAPRSLTESESPEPTSCGNKADVGDFTFNFEDLPPLGVGSGVDPDDVKPMPMFSPYHRFYFSQGFDVLPPPPAPFDPSSGNLMLQFTPSSITNVSEPDVPADAAVISVGPQASSTCFPFNFNGFSLGCDSKGSPCDFNITGLQFDHDSQKEREVSWLTVSVPACPSMDHCKLVPVKFRGFEQLTSVQITLTVDDEAKTWWADDLALGWSDNRCEKAVCRSKVRDSVRKRDGASNTRKATSRPLDFALFRG